MSLFHMLLTRGIGLLLRSLMVAVLLLLQPLLIALLLLEQLVLLLQIFVVRLRISGFGRRHVIDCGHIFRMDDVRGRLIRTVGRLGIRPAISWRRVMTFPGSDDVA